MAGIVGKYEMYQSSDYESYLKAVGVGAINRTLAGKAKPTLEYIDHGNEKWTQKTFTTFKNFEITFELGKEFTEKTADDRDAKSVITLEGNKFIHKQAIGSLNAVTTREFNGDEMISTFESNGVKAVRKFKRV